MSLGTEQVTRERQGSGAAVDAGRTEPTLGEETVPLRDAGERELERRREERVRLVVAGSGRRRMPGLRTAVLALTAVLACAGVIGVLAGGSSGPHRTEAGASAPVAHPVAPATKRTHAPEARGREARRRAGAKARRRASRRRRRVLAERRARARARDRRESAAPHRRAAVRASDATTLEAEIPAPVEAATEEAAPVAEEPAVVATPEPSTSEPSTSSSSTSSSEEGQAQKEFGFER